MVADLDKAEQIFRENGIEIAFRQVDIFLKNFKGQELQLPIALPEPAQPQAAEQPSEPPQLQPQSQTPKQDDPG